MLDTNVVAQAGAGVLDATIKIVLQENGVEVAPDWYLIDTPYLALISDGGVAVWNIYKKEKDNKEKQDNNEEQ